MVRRHASATRGRGVGRLLGEHVVAWHRAEGFAGIQFNAVVETNSRVGLHVKYLDLG